MKQVECLKAVNGDPIELDELEALASVSDVTLYRSSDGQLFLDAPGVWYLVASSEIDGGDYKQFVIDYMDGMEEA